MTSDKFNEVIKAINLMLKDSTLRLDKLEQDSIDEKYIKHGVNIVNTRILYKIIYKL